MSAIALLLSDLNLWKIQMQDISKNAFLYVNYMCVYSISIVYNVRNKTVSI